MELSLAVCLMILHALGANAYFEYKDCAPVSSTMSIAGLDILPNPILLPGNLHITLRGNNTVQINPGDVNVHMEMRKKGLFSMKIPCMDNVGSCDYDDICDVIRMLKQGELSRDIAIEIQNMFASAGVDVENCPFEVGSVNIQSYPIKLPEVNGALTWFAEGDYDVMIYFMDKRTGQKIFCVEAQVHLQQDDSLCSGISCFFGKK